MPLQEADLKSYDAYKRAMRADTSRITNTSQTKFWVYKDIELLDLQGKKNKIPAFLLLVDDSKARGFLHGKTLLCTGTCRLEESKISPKESWEENDSPVGSSVLEHNDYCGR